MKFKYDVYLAGPFFNDEQKKVMAQARAILEADGLKVCDPQDLAPVIVDLPEEQRKEALFEKIFVGNVDGMCDSRAILAWVDDKDTGTMFELGFFYSLKQHAELTTVYHHRPVFTFSMNGKPLNVMLSQAADGHSIGLNDLMKVNLKAATHE